eukprot:9985454-Lingulodinium_polyedra.AAC.1
MISEDQTYPPFRLARFVCPAWPWGNPTRAASRIHEQPGANTPMRTRRINSSMAAFHRRTRILRRALSTCWA